ncbi:DUF814 domain-containing protein [Candidatus Micrarchaeota archaeon]|nr:DUF814 domain-containing protein [Candidatus Micrarchaeota archaeon]
MVTELRVDLSLKENLEKLYERRKKLKKKLERMSKTISDTQKRLEKENKNQDKINEETELKIKRAQREKSWYEKFNWFITSEGKLAVGGKDAQQNDILYSKYFEDNDLFFHAEIKGASAVILKNGVNASERELYETAQFAACYSKAWVSGLATIDTYHMRKDQVSKHTSEGYTGKGGFALKGERKWYKNMELKLTLYAKEVEGVLILHVFPGDLQTKPKIVVVPGKKKKGEISKTVSKLLKVHPDEVIMMLPGNSEMKISR